MAIDSHSHTLKTQTMRNLFIFFFLIYCVPSLFCQSKNDCDAISNFFKQNIYSVEQFGEIRRWKDVKKIKKCIANNIIDIDSHERLSLNLSNLAEFVKSSKDRNNILAYFIKIQPLLSSEKKENNNLMFLSTLRESDRKIGKPSKLKMIRQNMGLNSFLQVLFLFSRPIKPNQKKEIQILFRNSDSLTLGIESYREIKWKSALLLAKQNDTIAENFLIHRINELVLCRFNYND